MSQPIVPIFVPTPDQANYIDGDLEVGGDTLIDGDLTVKGISTLGTIDLANVSTNGTLHVGGSSTFTGNVVMSGNLTVDGGVFLPNIQSGTGTLAALALNSSMELVVGSESGGGTVTAISTSDMNLVLTPDPIITTGTISINPSPTFTNLGTSTITNSGLVTSGSLTTTGGVAVGTTLGVTGTSTLGVLHSGAATVSSLTDTGILSVSGNSQLGTASSSATTTTAHNVLDDGTGQVSIVATAASASFTPFTLTAPNMIFPGALAMTFGSTTSGNFNAASLILNVNSLGSNTNTIQLGLKGAAKLTITGTGFTTITGGLTVNAGNCQLGTASGTNTTHTSKNTIDDGSGNVVIAGTLNALTIPTAGSGTIALVSQIPTVPIQVVYNVNSTGVLSLYGSAKGFSLASNIVTFPSLDGNNYLITTILNCVPSSAAYVTSAIKVTDSGGNSSISSNASVPVGSPTNDTSISNLFPYFNHIGSANVQLILTNVASVIGVMIITQIL